MNEDDKKKEIARDKTHTTVALSTSETVSRHGSANAEYIKGYTGIDNETGQTFAKSLKGIAQGKVHPDYAKHNIKQQAGYAAEVAATSRDNAEASINESGIRASRSDDLPQYGKNHTVIDRVKVLNGEIIEGSQSQMKFVGNRNDLFKKIAEDTQKGDAEFARYRNVRLELPSEQYKDAAEYCRLKANEFRNQAAEAAKGGAPSEVIERLQKNADHYEQLADNVVDSGLTTKDAIFYRTHPKIATVRDIARTSHRAGVQGAKYGAVIGGSISLLTSAFAVAQDKKSLDEATKDVVMDTGKGVFIGYATAATGAIIKGVMQQSGSSALRTLSHTNAPALAVQITLSLGGSVKRYVSGEIDETQFLEEVGEKGAGMLSAGMMAALGQIAIPMPFVGAAIGGMMGYTLSSMFYQAALDAGREAKTAQANLARVQAIQTEARAEIEKQRNVLSAFMAKEMPELLRETEQLFAAIDYVQDMDAFATSINIYADLMGVQLQFKSQMEFDHFMRSDEPLKWNPRQFDATTGDKE